MDELDDSNFPNEAKLKIFEIDLERKVMKKYQGPIIKDLKAQVKQLRKENAEYRKENAEYRKEIAELRLSQKKLQDKILAMANMTSVKSRKQQSGKVSPLHIMKGGVKKRKRDDDSEEPPKRKKRAIIPESDSEEELITYPEQEHVKSYPEQEHVKYGRGGWRCLAPNKDGRCTASARNGLFCTRHADMDIPAKKLIWDLTNTRPYTIKQVLKNPEKAEKFGIWPDEIKILINKFAWTTTKKQKNVQIISVEQMKTKKQYKDLLAGIVAKCRSPKNQSRKAEDEEPVDDANENDSTDEL